MDFVGKDMVGQFVWNAAIHNNNEGNGEEECPADVVLQEQIGGGMILDHQIKLNVTVARTSPGPTGPNGYFEWLREKDRGPVAMTIGFRTELLKVPCYQSSYRNCEPAKSLPALLEDQTLQPFFGLIATKVPQENWLGKKRFSWSEYTFLMPKTLECDIHDKRDPRCIHLPESYQSRPHNIHTHAEWCIGNECAAGLIESE
jgi:hypothetical protein